MGKLWRGKENRRFRKKIKITVKQKRYPICEDVFQKLDERDGEMVWGFKALVALAEDSGSVSSIYMVAHNPL